MKGAPVKIFDRPLIHPRIQSRGTLLATFLLLLAVPVAAGQAPTFPADPGLADYLAWAQENNPAVSRSESRQNALHYSATTVGALPDLKFGWGEMIVPVQTRTGSQQRIFSLSQSIPWFGTLGLRESVATARADAAAQSARGVVLRVRREVRSAWYDLAFLQSEIEIIRENLTLARQAEDAARALYETGVGSFGDVLAAQIDVEQLASQLSGLRDRVRPLTAVLNRAAGLPEDHPAPAAFMPSWLTADLGLPADDVLWSILEANNPDLAARRLEQEGRRQGVDLAGKAGYPGLTIGVDYIMTGPAGMPDVPDSGQDPVVARLGVSIPLWGGKAAAEKKMSASWLAVASADLTDKKQELKARLEYVLYAWREAGRNAELYGGVLLGRGRQVLEVTAAGYRSGQASYVDLVTARKTLLGLELAGLRAVNDRHQVLNDLTTLLGVSQEELVGSDGIIHTREFQQPGKRDS